MSDTLELGLNLGQGFGRIRSDSRNEITNAINKTKD
jgi:hypothetical protein